MSALMSSRRAFDAASRSFFERLALDLELVGGAAPNAIEGGRHAIDLHLDLEAASSTRSIALSGRKRSEINDSRASPPRRAPRPGSGCRGGPRSALEAAEDRDGVGDGRLRHEHRLEAALESAASFSMRFPVLVERRRADAAKLATRERRLEQVRRVHRASAAPAPTMVWNLVDEEGRFASGRLDLLHEHALRRSSNSPRNLAPATSAPMSSDDEALVLQGLGDVAANDALGDSLDDRRLADAGSPMSTGCSSCGARAPA